MTEELAGASGEAVTLREIPFLGQIGVRAVAGSPTADVVSTELGGPLPSGVGEVTAISDQGHVLWLGPDEYLAVLPDEADGGPDPARLVASLAEAVAGLPGQVVDLSANRTTLELRGVAAQQVLDKSCRLDLDEVSFPTGTAVATLLGSVAVILWRIESDTWRVLPRASFAVHVARWLMDGMREYV